jgi:DNA-binding NtrC family response regulator
MRESPRWRPEESSECRASASGLGRRRILVIDDERDLRETLADTLRTEGIEVEIAGDGQEGLALIGRQAFDVILCDLLMPTLDGQAFYEEVQRYDPHVLHRIVLMTSQAHSPHYGRFLREIGAPVLEKPFTIQQLCQVVTRMSGPGR